MASLDFDSISLLGVEALVRSLAAQVDKEKITGNTLIAIAIGDKLWSAGPQIKALIGKLIKFDLGFVVEEHNVTKKQGSGSGVTVDLNQGSGSHDGYATVYVTGRSQSFIKLVEQLEQDVPSQLGSRLEYTGTNDAEKLQGALNQEEVRKAMAKMVNQEFKINVKDRNIQVRQGPGADKVMVEITNQEGGGGTEKTESITITNKTGGQKVTVEFSIRLDENKNQNIAKMLAQAFGDSKVQKAVWKKGYEIVYKGGQLGFESAITNVEVKKAKSKSEAFTIAHSIALRLAIAQGAVLARKSVRDYVAAGGTPRFHSLVRALLSKLDEELGEEQSPDTADEIASMLAQDLRDLGSRSFYSLAAKLNRNGISGSGNLDARRLCGALGKSTDQIEALLEKEFEVNVDASNGIRVTKGPGENKVTVTIGSGSTQQSGSSVVKVDPGSDKEEIEVEFRVQVYEHKVRNQAIADRIKSAFEKALKDDTKNLVEELVKADFELGNATVNVATEPGNYTCTKVSMDTYALNF